MRGEAWVQLALEKLGCTQKELALRLGVSPAQVSKWKNDEHMSFDMEEKFRELTGIGERHPEFVVWSGSLSNAIKWENLIRELAELAVDSAETGYDTWPLQEEPELVCWQTFHTLREMGVDIPQEFPSDMSQLINQEIHGETIDSLLENPYADLIFRIYKSLNDVFGFYAAYIQELTNDDELDLLETGMEIESCLTDLAASKLEVPPAFAKNFSRFKLETTQDYEKWLKKVKSAAFRAGTPIRAELLDLVYDDHESLGFDAEAESLGVNNRRLHPDIYMNELLVGMRALHQVLPAIIKKLGITDEELDFDPSKLQI